MPKHLVLTVALLLSAATHAQTLARPGWAGSGLTVEPWWTHAVLYRIDPRRFSGDGLRGVAKQLDYVHSLGVDAIALTHLQPEASPDAVDPALGTLDDLDDLVREASRGGVRVLLELDPATTPELEKTARFWLNHGVAGISLRPGATPEQARTLHGVTKGTAGQRILVAAATLDDLASSRERAELLTVDIPPGNAAALRPVLARLSAGEGVRPLAMLGALPDANPDAAKVLATILLATRSNAQLSAGQEIGLAAGSAMPWGDPAKPSPPGAVEVASEEADPDSALNWYRRLVDLHHGNGVFRAGSVDFLDHDAQNSLVWVMRKPQITPTAPALVIACNLSDKPVTLSLTDDMRGLRLRGTFLRTIARSDHGLGGVGLNAVTLAPFGVYIGELRF